MSQQRFLVTGALGCIGAWVVRCLVREDVPVATFDLGGNPHRLRLIMDDDELARIQFIAGDITDLTALERAIGRRARRISSIWLGCKYRSARLTRRSARASTWWARSTSSRRPSERGFVTSSTPAASPCTASARSIPKADHP